MFFCLSCRAPKAFRATRTQGSCGSKMTFWLPLALIWWERASSTCAAQLCRLWEKLLRRNQKNSKQLEESLEHKLPQAFLSLDISQGSYRSWSSVPFSPPVQMRCREVKLWDRRALNSSIGSISLSTSSGWVLHPQPSEMTVLTTMCIDVWRWEDRRRFMGVVCVEVDMKDSSCLRGRPGRGVTLSLHIPGSETTVGSLPGKK